MTIDPFSDPPVTQAQRVIAKFGGALKLAAAMDIDASCVYRWTYPKSRGGSGGVIPGKSIANVLRVARLHGVMLTAEDLDPRAR